MEAPKVYPAPLHVTSAALGNHLPWADCKILFLWIRIRPDEIGHGTFMRDLSEAVNDFDLIDVVNGRAESAVNTEDGVVDDDTEREEIEHIGEILPYRG